MTVYVIIWEDRHTDVIVEIYAREDAAMDRAHEITESYPDAEISPPPDGWMYHADLTCEGDSVRVERNEVLP